MEKRTFLRKLTLGISAMSVQNITSFSKSLAELSETDYTMPALFVGHGAPMYVLDENKYSLAWRKIGAGMPKPKAIISISAHWLTRGKTLVTAMPKPKTIYDFGNFDDRLFELNYPASGAPQLAEEITKNVKYSPIHLDHDWGYDHGTWCVLYHMFPKANIPVIQLSIDYARDADYHFQLAKELAYLRKRGVLIMGSGNIVHNLRLIKFQEELMFDWAQEFDDRAKWLVDQGDFQSLIKYRQLGQAAHLSIPTPDHYFPLMYTLGLKTSRDKISYPTEGIAYGSTSMRSVMFSET